MFRWSSVTDTGFHSLRAVCDQWDGPSVYFRSVETTATEVALPMIASLPLPPDLDCSWTVTWFLDGPASTSRRRSSTSERRTVVIP